MAAQYIPIKRISSLDTPIKAEKLDGSLFTTENQAHEFIISVRKNGVKQTVTGSVSGKFIRANGTTIFLQGSIVDGDAVVRLHQDCYNVQGRFTFNIFNTQSGVTTCIYSAVGKMDMGSTETVIDAGDVVPDVADVVAKQEEMTQVIADARTATTAANTAATNVGSIVAPAYNPPYKAEEHCTQNGNLYKAKQDIPSDEEWTASHWTQIVVGDELADLKSTLGDVQDVVGNDVSYHKTFQHEGVINATISRFDISIPSGRRITVKVEDENNTGVGCALYVRYVGDSSNTTLANTIRFGTAHDFTLSKDSVYFSLYTTGLTAGNSDFEIAEHNDSQSTVLNRLNLIEIGLNEIEKKAPFNCVGFNVWDEEWTTNASGTYLKSKNLIPVIAGESYYYKAPKNFTNGVLFYDANGTQVGYTQYYNANGAYTVPDGACYMEFRIDNSYGITYNNDICINISQPNENVEPHNGQYVPYKYIGNYRDVLSAKVLAYETNKKVDAESADIAQNIQSLSRKSDVGIVTTFERPHETVLNQSISQVNIKIPKNWIVTLKFTDSVIQQKAVSVYVRYKGESSSVLLPSSVSLDDGLISFVTTKETEFISLYQTDLVAGTLKIEVKRQIQSKLSEIPEYYEDHMITKTAEIKANMMDVGKNGETFIFITDLHWENNDKNSPILVKCLFDNLNINNILCGGDLINEGEKDEMSLAMVECIRSFNNKNTFFPCAFGNHDSNKNAGNAQDRWFDENAEYALMQKQAEDHITYFTDSGWNFYFDAEQTKTRWIVCDTQENGTFTWYDELCALLNDTPDGYHVIISGHWFYDGGAKSTFAANLENIVDAFNAKTSVTISGATYDFSASNGSIPFVIGGHVHKDLDWTTTAGVPFILTDCDNGPRSGNTDYPYVKGTITEQAFDVVTVNYDENAKTVKCVRIGRGEDRDFTYGT